jgi:hypothetical protein
MVRVTPSPASFLQLQKKTTYISVDSQTVRAGGSPVTLLSVSGAGEVADLAIRILATGALDDSTVTIEINVDGTPKTFFLNWFNFFADGKETYSIKILKWDLTTSEIKFALRGIAFSKSLSITVWSSAKDITVSVLAVISQPAGG